MKPIRSVPLVLSSLILLFLLVGGLAVNVGAEDSSYHHVVVFSEVLSLVLDNYVDPLEADGLLKGAYEGMLASLDAHGAFLTPEELSEWKKFRPEGLADPGISVLRAGRALQVVAVFAGSSAEQAGLKVGDQIRTVDGRPVRDLSLDQSWRLILGPVGSTVKLDVLHASEGFRRKEVALERSKRSSRPFKLEVDRRGIAVLEVADMARIDSDELAQELDDVASRGITSLLIDLRNVADVDPRIVTRMARVLKSGSLLQLKSRSGELIESVESPQQASEWKGSVAVLVNGATAGSAEALASLVQSDCGGVVLGEPTYGLGSEPRLYEMEEGYGLLVSSAQWETMGGGQWNRKGLEPDELIQGRGTDYESRRADQFQQALELLEARSSAQKESREAA